MIIGHFLILIGSLAVILIACGLFTQGVEWLGKKYHLGVGAVGSVLAAVGTALPETLIPIVAFVFGSKGGHASDIGIGAILGAPLLLATLAFFITGFSAYIFRRKHGKVHSLKADYNILKRDLNFFFIVYSLAIASSFLSKIIPPDYRALSRWCVAIILFLLYVTYIKLTFAKQKSASDHAEDEELSPLFIFKQHLDPSKPMVFIQTFIGLAMIVVGAHFFVASIDVMAEHFKISALVLSLIIAPIATELPEKFNSVIWVRQGKDTLALGNISGAMVFQSSIVPAVGILCTDWVLDTIAIASALTAIIATLFVWIQLHFKKRISPSTLMIGGLLYIGYLYYIFGVKH